MDPSYLHTHLAFDDWTARRAAHKATYQTQMDAIVKRRSRHQKEPVTDFLFEYYAFRPAQFLRWSPGFGVFLEGATPEDFFFHKRLVKHPEGVYLRQMEVTQKRRRSIAWVRDLLEQVSRRPPALGCFGMHEWAMVYKADAIRHENLPLRMSPGETDAFVDTRPVRCTHFDAFRFFTPPARPKNILQPSVENMQDLEQPGCLHTNMDLYKWAYKLYPWVGSDLIAKAYSLALEARTLDMQASPYDVSSVGLTPIRIETEEGRQLYQQRQESLANKSASVREELIEAYTKVLEAVSLRAL